MGAWRGHVTSYYIVLGWGRWGRHSFLVVALWGRVGLYVSSEGRLVFWEGRTDIPDMGHV